MDDEILKTVHSIFGKDVKIVDCEKMSSVRQEEVLFINGVPVQLDGLACDEADAIKAALLIGQMPSVDLLNQLLVQAGLLKQPVQLETSLSVKSSMVTTEEVSVSRGGCVLDERLTETKEDYTYNSNKKEFWQPHLHNISETECSGAAEINSVKGSPPKRPERKNREDASLCKSAMISLLSQPTATANRSDEGNDERYAVRKTTRGHDSDDTKHLCSSGTASSMASTISNYSTYPTDSTMDITSTALAASSCSFMLNQAAKASNIPQQRMCKKSSLSYDSGHDGIFHSMSQRAANSLSCCCDLISCSSCNEIVQVDNLEDEGAAKMKTTKTTQNNVVPYPENYDVELKGSNAQHQMLPMPSNVNSGRKSGDSNGSTASIKKAISNADTSLTTVQCSTASTNVILSTPETSISPSSSTKNHSDHSNIAEIQHLNKHGQKSYQYFRPQSLLTQQLQQQEPVDEQHCLVYYNNQLVSGSLEALIEHMVPTCDYYPTSTYIFSFLLSARLFIRPHELLSKISATWEQQQQQEITNTDVVDDAKEVRKCFLNSTDATISPDKMCAGATITTAVFQKQRHQQLSMQLSAHNCIRLLAEWIETFPYDFRDERLMQQVRILARKCVYIDNALGKQVSQILQLLVQRLTVLEKYEDFLQSLTTAELHATDSKQEKSFASSTGTSTTTAHNPLGRSSTTALSTAIKSQPLLQSSLSAGNASTSLSTQAAHSHNSILDAQQHNHPQSDSSTNSVNLTLHHLSGHFTNSNSSSSFNDIPGIMDLCASSAQLAHQLTTIELERLSHIGPEEFVQAFAKEYQQYSSSLTAKGGALSIGNAGTQDGPDFTGNVAAVMCTSLSDIKKTRNLESYVQWFNRLSYLTASEIVKYSKKKLRVRIIEYWIETARECFNIGNFNSLMAIIAGLNLAPISRLKKTWSKVQSAKFSVLEHQMDPTSNFNSYRSTLKAAMWRSEGATDERERIIIPFFSLFVKDLYFLNEGCSNRLANNHINFEKCSQLSKQVMEFNEWKKVNCPFEKHPIVIMFLQSSPVLNENTLSMASFECEPPENTQEKGRYKTLKSETKQQMQQQLHEQKHQQQH